MFVVCIRPLETRGRESNVFIPPFHDYKRFQPNSQNSLIYKVIVCDDCDDNNIGNIAYTMRSSSVSRQFLCIQTKQIMIMYTCRL